VSERLLTVKETAEALRLSAATVYALCSQKAIRHERVGTGRGKIVVPESAINEYRKARTMAAAVPGAAAVIAPAPAPSVRLTNLRLRSGG
jgi:excisionase family DNA binding protein